MEASREDVRPRWSGERARSVLGGVRGRLRRRRWARATAAGLAAAAMALFMVLGGGRATVGRAPVARVDAPATAAARDWTATRTDPSGDLRLIEASPARVVVRVERGAARFEVRRAGPRLFRVEAGSVAVQVLGTAFTVARAGDGAEVSVEEGRVRVFWAGQYADLGAGARETFPRPGMGLAADAGATAEEPVAVAVAVAVAPQAPVAPRAAPARSPRAWAALAEAGRYDDAYAALRVSGGPAARSIADLLLAADVARLSHHPEAAVDPLRRVLDGHRDDPRAPLAAFTLGRLLLDDLGAPLDAARAFARARELDPDGELSEDAMAREVEAWSRAGEGERARSLAATYLVRHPDGRRARSVRRFGGVE
jgi:transmembrane sensor